MTLGQVLENAATQTENPVLADAALPLAPDTVLHIDDAAPLMDPVAEDQQLQLDFKRINADDASFGSVSLIPKRLKKEHHCQECGAAQGKPTFRRVLHDISGCCKPGELLALMGPSGSGKTSLLTILGGRASKMVQVAGQVLYNDRPITKRAKRHIGFVLQDDHLYESLTVWETLWYAAQLRLPREMSKSEKKERVENVIASLGLSRCRNTIIGNYFFRGVSGGERKRVSVGHEMLVNPSLLLLDEPTSGLDSTTALQLVATLRSLASGGRSVITTIHQPSARLYGLLDKLLLLANGRPLYYGRAGMAADWFHRLGYTLPYGTNIADYILDLASGTVAAPTRSGAEGLEHLTPCSAAVLQMGDVAFRNGAEGLEHLKACSTAFLKSGNVPQGYVQGADLAGLGLTDIREPLASRLSDGGGRPAVPIAAALQPHNLTPVHHTSLRKMYGVISVDVKAGSIGTGRPASASSGGNGYADADDDMVADFDAATADGMAASSKRMLPQPAGGSSKAAAGGRKQHRWGATYWQQFRVLFARSLKTRRFESLSMQDILQFLVVGVLAGVFWLNVGTKPFTRDASNITGLLFFELLFLAFRIMFIALFTFPQEHSHMLLERASGMYRLSAFYFARTASDLPMDCSIPTIFIAIIYWMSGLRRTAGGFFANWAAVMLVQLVAQSLGLLIGATVMNPKSAQTLTSVVTLIMMLVGGFYITNLPGWISWLKYLSYIYFGYNLLLKIELHDKTLFDCGANYFPADYRTNPACDVILPHEVTNRLSLPANTQEWPWEALVMIGWLLLFRGLVYVALRIKTKS